MYDGIYFSYKIQRYWNVETCVIFKDFQTSTTYLSCSKLTALYILSCINSQAPIWQRYGKQVPKNINEQYIKEGYPYNKSDYVVFISEVSENETWEYYVNAEEFIGEASKHNNWNNSDYKCHYR